MQILLNTIMLEPKRWHSPKSVTVPLIKLLPDIKRAGFNELEIWGYHLWNINEDELFSISEELKVRDMVASSIGSYLTEQEGPRREGILSAAKRYFSICEKLESKRLRIFYGNKDFEKSSQDYLQFIDEIFEEIFKMGQDKGIIVMPEMHKGTVIGSIKGLRRVLGIWGKNPNFGVVYQPYEFNTESALEALDAALGHIQSVHLQNRHDDHFVALTEGDIDYRQVLKKLAISNYSGPFVLEFTRGVSSSVNDFDYRDVLRSAAKDKEWIESTWRKVNEEAKISA